MNNILALIYNKNINKDEAIVASAESIKFLIASDGGWLYGKRIVKAFSTSKNLKSLEKTFKKKDMAVYLHLIQELNIDIKYKTSQNRNEAQNTDRKSTRLNSSHIPLSRMPSSA